MGHSVPSSPTAAMMIACEDTLALDLARCGTLARSLPATSIDQYEKAGTPLEVPASASIDGFALP
jgi:hypothetical protein